MTRGKKLSPDEAWDALQKMALRDQAERVSKLSDQELDRELASKGVDPKALRARGAALAEKLRAAAHEEPTKPSDQAPKRQRPGWVAMVAAACFGAGALTVGIPAVLVPIARPPPDLAPDPLVPPSTSLQHEAASLRRIAKDACARRLWSDCLKALDAAKVIDPEGENSTEVRQERSAIEK
jgi:hypothetical protein